MNWNSTEFVWLDWLVLAIGVVGERQKSSEGRRLFCLPFW